MPPGVIEGIDLERLAGASEGLTPADIEDAGRRASQEVLARPRASLQHRPGRRGGDELTTDDYVSALAATRATVSDESLQEILEDIDSIVRL